MENSNKWQIDRNNYLRLIIIVLLIFLLMAILFFAGFLAGNLHRLANYQNRVEAVEDLNPCHI